MDLIRVKNMLNSTISMSYPDVVIACIEHKVFQHSEQLRQRWWSTIIIWRIIPGGWLITITANHSNYLVCGQSQHAVCHCQESGKTATQLLHALVLAHLLSSCSEGRTRDVHSSSLLIDVYALFSDVSLHGRFPMTQAEKFRTLFAQERC